jgi:hypothetical protein
LSFAGRINFSVWREENSMGKKKKKDKITYIDDGRTIADMSGVTGNRKFSSTGTTSSPKEIWNTYWTAVRMMFKPMLVVIGFLVVLYVLAYLAFLIM